jgi:DNA-directed RNA polymerase specialized sigma24 family protein
MSNEEICKRIQAGDTELFEVLLEQNRGIIHQLAHRYLPYVTRKGGAEYDDLVQAAALGMIVAVNRWQATRGSFITIAHLCMRRALRDVAGLTSSKREIESMRMMLPLDAPIDPGNPGSALLSDAVADENAVNPAEACADADMFKQIRAAVRELPPGPQDAITRVYFNGECQPTGSARSAFTKGMNLLRGNKRIRALRDQCTAVCYRNKSANGFATSWSSIVEDAVIRREKWNAEIERLSADREELFERLGIQRD